jgi:hypothetical protein
LDLAAGVLGAGAVTMQTMIRRAMDRVLGGRGEFSITVPTLDGPLKPNDYLERAAGVATVPDADNIVSYGSGALLSSGKRVLTLSASGAISVHSEHEAEVTCLAVSPAGDLAVGLDGIGIKISGPGHDGMLVEATGASKLHCPTSAVFPDADTLVVCNGSARFTAAQWRHDFIHRKATGSVVKIDLPNARPTILARDLAYPSGLCLRHGMGDELIVSEAWAHQIVGLSTRETSIPKVILGGLPGYPGRILPAASGGYWLAVFAVRSQLQEFVLREDRFRRRMIQEVDPAYWIAPALSSGHSFKEPLQAGGVIRLGIHKPWAPTRSYGLILRLDDNLEPLWSCHSRADGKRHGMTAMAEVDGALLATSKGKGEVIRIAAVSLAEPQDLYDPRERVA